MIFLTQELNLFSTLQADSLPCEPPGYSNVLKYTATAAAAAAAKSLQSCATLCDPMDGSPPGSAVLGILQARTLEWVAISFSMKYTSFICFHFLSVLVRFCPPLNLTNFMWFFFIFYFIFKLYNIVLVLPNIEMNPPQVYMCSPS